MEQRAVAGFFTAVLGVVLATGAAGQGSDPAKPEPSGQAVHRSAPEALQHLQPAPHLVQRLGYNLKKQYYKSLGFKSNEVAELLGPPPKPAGTPSTGTVHIPVLVIAFDGTAADHTGGAILANCNGPGNAALYPYESLAEYYQRSSYGQLNLVFDVFYGYQAPLTRAQYAADNDPAMDNPTASCPDGDAREITRRTLMVGAIQYYDSQGADFSKYDNDNDGTIDDLIAFWAGYSGNSSAAFWWDYHQRNCNPWAFQVDGKSLHDYVWASEKAVGDSSLGNSTLIHEFGHVLGLPDYYDKDFNIGPDGGLGHLDMMDYNWGDHNCFSKFLLEWIDPFALTTFDTYGFILNPSGSHETNSSKLIMPGFDPADPYGEFFMVQNRYWAGNDIIMVPSQSLYPGNGLLIWHVDATLDAAGHLKYNNSNTAHKLLRLMEADGLEEIEAGDNTVANSGDYYTDGDVFGPATVPSSARYNGVGTGIRVDSISQSRTGEISCEVTIAPAQGDLDYDGDVDAADMLLLAWCLAGNLDLVDPAQSNMYFDSLINVTDLLVGLEFTVGNIPAPYHAATGAGSLYDTDPIVGNLMYVPAGTFTQGSPAGEPCRNSDETQFSHTLTRDFAVMATEVTRQMWADLRVAQPTLPPDPTALYFGSGLDNPVQNNSWYTAVLFANLLSSARGYARCYYKDAGFTIPLDATNYYTGPFYCNFDADGYRLPTEGEWEYFCRAGTTTPFWITESNYTSGNCDSSSMSGMYPQFETVAWFSGNSSSLNRSSPVATKASSLWGLYDSHGNVQEWCWDWYQATYPTGSASDYTGATSGSYRVLRGGHWCYNARLCRSARRESGDPSTGYCLIGFRLVRTIG